MTASAFTNTTVGANMVVHTGRDNDVLNLEGATINRDLVVRTGRQSDVVRAANTNIGNKRIHRTREFTMTPVVFDAVTVARNVWVNGWAGHDDVAVMNSSIGGLLWTGMYSGVDFVFVDSSTVGGPVVIPTHRGV